MDKKYFVFVLQMAIKEREVLYGPYIIAQPHLPGENMPLKLSLAYLEPWNDDLQYHLINI